MATAYISNTSGYIPSHEATGKLVVDFSRNADSFAVNKYAQIVPVTATTGIYLKMTPDQAARVSSGGAEFIWPDGQAAPTGSDNHKEFEFASYFTQRFAPSFSLGSKTVKETPWDVVAAYGKMAAQQAMTLRTRKVVTALTTSGNYGSTAAATAAGGGKWDVGTATAPYIMKGLQYARLAIHKATVGAIKPSDLVLVVSPGLATLMASSQEVHSYLKESPSAWAEIVGDRPNYNANWGLPQQLYGTPIVVEDAVVETANKGATASKSTILGDTVAALIARPGGLEGNYGGPSYSFLTQFMLEEMTVEVKDDPDNRRTVGRVVEDYAVVATAPAAGFYFTAVSG